MRGREYDRGWILPNIISYVLNDPVIENQPIDVLIWRSETNPKRTHLKIYYRCPIEAVRWHRKEVEESVES